MKRIIDEIRHSRVLLIFFWVLVGQGAFEVVRSLVVVYEFNGVHNDLLINREKIEARTADTWTRNDMRQLVEEFNRLNPQVVPAPLLEKK